MKRQLFIIIGTSSLLSLAINVAMAQAKPQPSVNTPGFYIGIQNGVAFVDYKNEISPGFTASSVLNVGLGSRVYGGFDITHHFATEIGIVYFHKPRFRSINGGIGAKVKNNMIFLVGKGLVLLTPKLTAYASLGIGYVARSGIILNNTVVLSDKEIVRPMYGLGMAYLFWKRWSVDLSWLQAAKKNKEHLPSSNFIGIGIRYKFAG